MKGNSLYWQLLGAIDTIFGFFFGFLAFFAVLTFLVFLALGYPYACLRKDRTYLPPPPLLQYCGCTGMRATWTSDGPVVLQRFVGVVLGSWVEKKQSTLRVLLVAF